MFRNGLPLSSYLFGWDSVDPVVGKILDPVLLEPFLDGGIKYDLNPVIKPNIQAK